MARITDNMFDGFETGDVVEVTIKGVLSRSMSVIRPGEYNYFVNGVHMPNRVESVRLVEPAEPEYEVGEVYATPNGSKYTRLRHGWRGCTTGIAVGHNAPMRPLRKLA